MVVGSATLMGLSSDGRSSILSQKLAVSKCKSMLRSPYGNALDPRPQTAAVPESERGESGDLPATEGHLLLLWCAAAAALPCTKGRWPDALTVLSSSAAWMLSLSLHTCTRHAPHVCVCVRARARAWAALHASNTRLNAA